MMQTDPTLNVNLTRALDDQDSETRISVIWALGSSGDPAVVSKLFPKLSCRTWPRVSFSTPTFHAARSGR